MGRTVMPDFLSAAECRSLVDMHRRFAVQSSAYHAVSTARVATARELAAATDAERRLVQRVRRRVREAVLTELAAPRPLFVNMTQISSLGRGGVVPLHADDCTLDTANRWTPTFWFRRFSALVYLDESGVDFGGGVLEFVRVRGQRRLRLEVEAEVVPRRGTLVAFTSGPENAHRTTPVTHGLRHVVALWFCHERRFAEPMVGHAVPAAQPAARAER
jgi:predicted 2-oxoglutarate/Fe(II)-dependent dioxygenase YbiX